MPEHAAKLVSAVTIHHPYGLVGKLPWQTDPGSPSVAFGGFAEKQLRNLADQIKTFTEYSGNTIAKQDLSKSVADATTILFLGFAYHRQNLELLEHTGTRNAVSIFGTSLGFSEKDTSLVARKIVRMFQSPNKGLAVNIQNNWRCEQLFSENWLSLSES
jgi:hypothetical protein